MNPGVGQGSVSKLGWEHREKNLHMIPPKVWKKKMYKIDSHTQIKTAVEKKGGHSPLVGTEGKNGGHSALVYEGGTTRGGKTHFSGDNQSVGGVIRTQTTLVVWATG